MKFKYTETLAAQFEEIGEIGYFVFDAIDEKFLYVSTGFAQIYGVCRIEHQKNIQSLDDDLAFILDEDRDQVHAAYQKYLCRGENCIVEYRIKRTDGSIRWLRESSAAQRVNNGKVELTIGAVQDITEKKITEEKLLETQHQLELKVEERTAQLSETIMQLEKEIRERERMASELEFLANHDPLTGLPSVRLCKDRIRIAIDKSNNDNGGFAVLFFDLDGFKVVNDNFGHEVGDQMLRVIAERIKSAISDSDTLARIGGDEFVLILENTQCQNDISRIAGRLNEKISHPIHLSKNLINVSACIGISVYPGDGSNSSELISNADKAMYRVKKNGKNSFEFAQRQI